MFIGIDPGMRGAIAVVSSKSLKFWPMPKHDEEVWDIFMALHKPKIEHIMIEKCQAMPQNGAVSMFNFGNRYGAIRGMVIALKCPFTLVRPTGWQKTMFAGSDAKESPKARAYSIARKIFPKENFVLPRCRKPHDGVIDAALIAEFCRRRMS